jgi:hypothetical protein
VADPAEKIPAGYDVNSQMTIEGLAAAQRVRPADDLDAIASSWPVDDDPDALDAFIRDQRRQRRKAAHGS